MGKIKGLVFGAVFCGLLAGSLAGTGCGSRPYISPEGQETESGEEKPLKVVATLFPYYDFTRQIAGDMVDLELMIPAGMDSHSFEPTPADMKKLQEADVVICNGGAMEYWVSQVLDAVERPGRIVVTMMDYVDAFEEEVVEGMEDSEDSHDHHGHHDHEDHSHQREDAENKSPEYESEGDNRGQETETEYDEHIWTSPVNAMRLAEVITDTLAVADPANEKEYRERGERYQEELMEIHQGFLQVAEDRKRNLIVVGDKFPFRYLAEEYGFEYRAAFTGCSTDTEPSARTIAYLIDKVKEAQIPAVYYLELSSHRVSEIIGEETGAEPVLLHSCHNVTRKELEDGVTYVELMKQNVENLRKGLDE